MKKRNCCGKQNIHNILIKLKSKTLGRRFLNISLLMQSNVRKKWRHYYYHFAGKFQKLRKAEELGQEETIFMRASSFRFAFKAMIFLQNKDEPRRRLNTIVEDEHNYSDLLTEEIGASPVDEEIQNSENLKQTPSKTSVQNSQQMTPQPSAENLVRMLPPAPKPPITKSTKRSRTNHERLDKAFSILEASASVSKQNEESESQIFGKLVDKKLQAYTSKVSSIMQEELMKILFKADRGFYNKISEQESSEQVPPEESVSQQNIICTQQHPQKLSYNTGLNANHPRRNLLHSNVIFTQSSFSAITTTQATILQHSQAGNYFSNFSANSAAGLSNHNTSQISSPDITPTPQHSPGSNYDPNNFPNTPATSMDSDESSEMYQM